MALASSHSKKFLRQTYNARPIGQRTSCKKLRNLHALYDQRQAFKSGSRSSLSLWSSGKANNHDVAKMCVHITACGIEHFKSTVPDCNADMLRNAEDEIIRTFICSLTASLFHASKQKVEYTVLCDLLYSFFVEQLSQKWEALLLLLEELPLVVLKGVPTTLKLVSEESSKSFQQICSTYRQLSDGGLSRSNGSDAAEQHSGI